MTYSYEWPQASPCSTIILYTLTSYTDDQNETYTRASFLITERDPSVGAGKSLSAGGFDEVKDTFNRAGEMIDGIEDTYREMHEELGEEIKTILPYESFKNRVQYLWDGMVPNKKHPIVEKVVFRAMEVTPNEMKQIMALPSTSEQIGKKLEHFIIDNPSEPITPEIVEKVLTGFKYDHEVEAAKMLCEKLSRNAIAMKPSGGPGW